MGRLKLWRGDINPIKARWERLSRRVRRALLAIQLISLLIYAIYLVYEIATGAFIVFKSILLAATVAYGIFYTIQHDKIDKPSRARRKIGKRIYTFIKIIVKGCTLGLTFYGLFAATVTTTFWSVTLALSMLFIWIFSLVFEIISWLVDRRVTKLRNMAKDKYNETKSRVTSGISEAKAKVTEGYNDTKARITDGVNKVNEVANEAKERVSEGIEKAKDNIEKAKDSIEKATTEAKEKARVGAEKVKKLLTKKEQTDTLPSPTEEIPIIDAPADAVTD